MVLGAERRTSKAEYLYIGSSIPNGKIYKGRTFCNPNSLNIMKGGFAVNGY